MKINLNIQWFPFVSAFTLHKRIKDADVVYKLVTVTKTLHFVSA